MLNKIIPIIHVLKFNRTDYWCFSSTDRQSVKDTLQIVYYNKSPSQIIDELFLQYLIGNPDGKFEPDFAHEVFHEFQII